MTLYSSDTVAGISYRHNTFVGEVKISIRYYVLVVSWLVLSVDTMLVRRPYSLGAMF